MQETVHVAAVQMDVKRELDVNLGTMRLAIESLAASGPIDLVVFPELANSGYLHGGDKAFGGEYLKLAEKVPGTFTKTLGEIARQHHVHI
ncbi:MAG: nitrilase-related carbon-nitrogen hydrolase, partial [Chloroflexota bacterium]